MENNYFFNHKVFKNIYINWFYFGLIINLYMEFIHFISHSADDLFFLLLLTRITHFRDEQKSVNLVILVISFFLMIITWAVNSIHLNGYLFLSYF